MYTFLYILPNFPVAIYLLFHFLFNWWVPLGFVVCFLCYSSWLYSTRIFSQNLTQFPVQMHTGKACQLSEMECLNFIHVQRRFDFWLWLSSVRKEGPEGRSKHFSQILKLHIVWKFRLFFLIQVNCSWFFLFKFMWAQIGEPWIIKWKSNTL